MGEFEAIEAHPEKSDTQVITFKDRKTAERFMHGVKDIPGVGAVELAWVNGPLVPAGKATVVRGGDAEGDATMGNSNANGGPPPHASGVENVEVDYDVAEEDDRWMAS